MVQLADVDIKTREVLDWQGVHVLHHPLSSCSQKLRIFLNLKGVAWESHVIDLLANENLNEWFLGINPRGLLPVLVHDGAVHIESNDILIYVDGAFPVPCDRPEIDPVRQAHFDRAFPGPIDPARRRDRAAQA